MWKPKKTIKNDTIAPPLPSYEQPPTTIHNHAPSEFGKILGFTVAPFVGIFAAWFVLMTLLSLAGFDNPIEEAAKYVLFIPVIAGASYLGVKVAQAVIFPVVDKILDSRERVTLAKLDHEARSMIIAPVTLATGRAMEDELRFMKLVLAVMQKAYDVYYVKGRFKGTWRPWSRISVQSIDLYDKKKTTQQTATRVREWLEQERVLVNDQINITKYPKIEAVQELLMRRFDKPISINPPLLGDSRSNYEFIDNSE